MAITRLGLTGVSAAYSAFTAKAAGGEGFLTTYPSVQGPLVAYTSCGSMLWIWGLRVMRSGWE